MFQIVLMFHTLDTDVHSSKSRLCVICCYPFDTLIVPYFTKLMNENNHIHTCWSILGMFVYFNKDSNSSAYFTTISLSHSHMLINTLYVRVFQHKLKFLSFHHNITFTLTHADQYLVCYFTIENILYINIHPFVVLFCLKN